MRDSEPTVETIKPAEAKQRWDEILDAVARRERRVVVESDGKPVAAIISFRDFELFNWYLERRKEDFAILDEIGKKFADVPADEIEQEVAKALAEVRVPGSPRRTSTG
jgi:prevent-host-death family protein